MKNLEHVSKKEFLGFLKSFDHVIFDIDGVLQYSKTTIFGADLCVRSLRKLNKKLAVVSNNTITPREMLVKGLKEFEIVDEEVVRPTEALLSYLKKINFNKDIYVIGGSNIKSELRLKGYNIVDIKPQIVEFSDLKRDCLETIENYSNIGAIVADIDFNFNLVYAERAITLLNHCKDIILLFGPLDESGPLAKDVIMLGPKFYVDSIRSLGQKEGLNYAKPSRLLAQYLNKKCNIADPKRVLFVGDNLAVDVKFGHENGYQTLLVFTGQTQKDDIENWKRDSELAQPDYYVTSLKELNDLLIQYLF